MDDIIENNCEVEFANGQSSRDLRTSSDNLHERTDLRDPLEALRKDSDEIIERRIGLPGRPRRKSGTSVGSPWYRRINKRVVLLVLLVLAVGAVSPFAWNYLQSYESTDDAQIDGHIDPLELAHRRYGNRRACGGGRPRDQGELLVEIDPRDYEVAVEPSQAHVELALAQVASAKQDYDAALANVREADATNYKAQRDAQRYISLFKQEVVAQEQYDQYTSIAQVDAAKVDSAREAAASNLKTIAAHE